MILLRLAALLGGVALVVAVVDSAVRTFVVPRGLVSMLTRGVFEISGKLFGLVAKPSRSYATRDRIMAIYAPLTLLALPIVWLLLICGGFTLMFWAVERNGWAISFRLSGSSLLTLGFDHPASTAGVVVSFAEATFGLAMVALLISYLPTLYGNFSRRETMVARLAVRAGTPPSAAEFLERATKAGFLDQLDELFASWEVWFVELEETHTSLGMLSFFRSPNPHRSWVTAAGAVLDTAALSHALLDRPFSPQPGLCIRAGYLALRSIAQLLDQPFDSDPAPDGPISISREEFDELYERLAAAGTPLLADREAAWRSFAGWRVNYDEPLLRLAALLMVPYAPWSSDRSLQRQRPRLVRRAPRS